MAKAKRNNHGPRLFKEKLVPADPGSEEFFKTEYEGSRDGVVECLGKTFPSDEKRREYFTEKLCQKLKDPEFRKIEGFPLGADEDIITLSDPPYYTACPNPFIADCIKHHGKPYDPKQVYTREPFAADVSEGKRNPIYGGHAYHTKVPHKAIMRYILHYTSPGDIVLDVFAGTGMTGIACQMCADPQEVAQLVDPHTDRPENKPICGSRNSVLIDLAPAATFIAHNYTHRPSPTAFTSRSTQALKHVKHTLGWMYETASPKSGRPEELLFRVWSDVFICPECGADIVFARCAVDKQGAVSGELRCSHCDSLSSKRTAKHAFETLYDPVLNTTRAVMKQIPVEVCCRAVGSKRRYVREVGQADLDVLERVKGMSAQWHPVNKMMFEDGCWGDQWRKGYHSDVTHDYQFYMKRPLTIMAALYDQLRDYPPGIFLLTGSMLGLSRLQRYTPGSTFPNMIRSGTLYIGSLHREWNAISWLQGKARGLERMYQAARHATGNAHISTNSAASIPGLHDASVDYIFIDPPFGDNLAYSELNFLWEGWLKVFTRRKEEAVVSKHQGKALAQYASFMERSFRECFRVLKPGRWMTVEFHNSRNSVWTAIQEGIQRAGFVVADVRVLDKKQRGFNAITAAGAVNQDLVISAYRPNDGLEARFQLEAGTRDGVWDFIRTHLNQLPLFVEVDGRAEVIAERQNYLLFDRMVAFHVQRGISVPLSAADFYEELDQRHGPARDGMYFLPDQGVEYDKRRMSVSEVLQLEFFVTDEFSAIQWLRQRLLRRPHTAGELKPLFMQEIGGWQKSERILELDELLEQNFLRYDGAGGVPTQIHSYLSSNFKDLRNLSKHDERLRTKGKDRWYVPDPKKMGDLERLREKALLREFGEYEAGAQKRLKVFRLEAVRAGFKRAWQERDYDTIIAVAQKIPEDVLQEDSKLLMWYDQAMTRKGETE